MGTTKTGQELDQMTASNTGTSVQLPSDGIDSASASSPDSLVAYQSGNSGSTPKSTGRREGRWKGPIVDDPRWAFPDSMDNQGRPMWLRPSDGQLVYLKCESVSCDKIHHKSIHGFLAHTRLGHKRKVLPYGNHIQVMERCGILPAQLAAGGDFTDQIAESGPPSDGPQEGDEDDRSHDQVDIKAEFIEAGALDEDFDLYGDDLSTGLGAADLPRKRTAADAFPAATYMSS